MAAFLNVGRRCGNQASCEEVIRAVEHEYSCQVVFISEMDAHMDQRRVLADGWAVHRHYCGQGTCAYGWALRASAQRFVIGMHLGHMCSGLELALPGESRPRQSVMILGLHAPYESSGVDVSAANVSLRSFDSAFGRDPCWWQAIGMWIRAPEQTGMRMLESGGVRLASKRGAHMQSLAAPWAAGYGCGRDRGHMVLVARNWSAAHSSCARLGRRLWLC